MDTGLSSVRTGQGAPAPRDLLLTLPNSPLGRQRPQVRGRAHDLSSRPHPVSQVQTPDLLSRPPPAQLSAAGAAPPKRPSAALPTLGRHGQRALQKRDSQAEGALV